MPTSTDINLPNWVKPIFPDRCVACGVEQPGDQFRVGTNAIGWWTLAFWTLGARFTVEVPACSECSRSLTRQRWLRLAGSLVFVGIGVGVAIVVLGSVRGIRRVGGDGDRPPVHAALVRL